MGLALCRGVWQISSEYTRNDLRPAPVGRFDSEFGGGKINLTLRGAAFPKEPSPTSVAPTSAARHVRAGLPGAGVRTSVGRLWGTQDLLRQASRVDLRL